MSFFKYVSPKLYQLSLDGFFVSLGKIASALGALFGVYFLTKYLSPSEYGMLNLAITFSIAVNQLIIGPLGAGSTRFYSSSVELKDNSSFFNSIFKLLKFASYIIFILGILIIIIMYTLDLNSKWIWLICIAVIFSIISAYNTIFNGIQVAARNQAIVALHQGLEPWIKTLVAIGLILFIGSTSFSAILGYTLGILIILISQITFIKQLIQQNKAVSDKDNVWIDKITKYSLPFVLWGGFTAVQLISDRWALQIFSSVEEVGMYSVLYQIGYFPVILIIGILVQIITPYFYNKAGDGSDSSRIVEIAKAGKYLIYISLGLTILVAILTYFVQDLIFEYLIAENYRSVAYMLPYMTISAGLFASGQVATLILQSKASTTILIKPKIITSLVGIVLNFIGAYFFGIEGVVAALIIYAIIYLLWIVIITFHQKGVLQ